MFISFRLINVVAWITCSYQLCPCCLPSVWFIACLGIFTFDRWAYFNLQESKSLKTHKQKTNHLSFNFSDLNRILVVANHFNIDGKVIDLCCRLFWSFICIAYYSAIRCLLPSTFMKLLSFSFFFFFFCISFPGYVGTKRVLLPHVVTKQRCLLQLDFLLLLTLWPLCTSSRYCHLFVCSHFLILVIFLWKMVKILVWCYLNISKRVRCGFVFYKAVIFTCFLCRLHFQGPFARSGWPIHSLKVWLMFRVLLWLLELQSRQLWLMQMASSV